MPVAAAHQLFNTSGLFRVLIEAKSRDAMPTPQLDPALKVIPVRALHNAATRAFTRLQLTLLTRKLVLQRLERVGVVALLVIGVAQLRPGL